DGLRGDSSDSCAFLRTFPADCHSITGDLSADVYFLFPLYSEKGMAGPYIRDRFRTEDPFCRSGGVWPSRNSCLDRSGSLRNHFFLYGRYRKGLRGSAEKRGRGRDDIEPDKLYETDADR